MQKFMSRKKKRKTNFIVQGSILAAAGIIVRLIGLVYRIPLVNILGTTGSGLYSSAYNIYTILLLLSSYSLPLAVSKMVAERVSYGEYKNAHRVFKGALLFALGAGTAMALAAFFGAGFFARIVLNKPDASYAIRTLAPTVFVMAFLGVYRGYYQGLGTMIPTAVSQILEQIFNAVFSILGAWWLFSYGTKTDLVQNTSNLAPALGAAGGAIGTGAGAFIALLFCMMIFTMYRRVLKKQMRRDPCRQLESYPDIAKLIVMISLPVILSTTVYNISSVLDQSLFGYYTEFAGIEGSYMDIWGVYSSIYMLMINVPIAISNALASSVIPSLTAAVAKNERSKVLSRTSLSIRFTMLIAIPSAVGLTVLSGPIVKMLFSVDTGLGAELLLTGSAAVVFFSLSTVMNAILQGINHMGTPVKNAAISLAIHMAVLAACLYGLDMGIYGVVFANMLFGLGMCLLNGRSIAKYLQYRQEIKKTFLLPTLASLVMGGACYGTYTLVYRLLSHNLTAVLLAILAAVAVYGVLLLLLKCIDEIEMYQFPFGRKLVRVAKILHLL
ncbi:MAG: polysaccharide biosynthesis protein [Lachnospiraceae bacterium]|nr:polysaccharide biosynthesis protein [Lachnospiraceae bacterium]